MNHITRLQADLSQDRSELEAKAEAVQDFLIHLAGDKFIGPAPDGSRKDWIAITDVRAWLSHIRSAGA